MEYGWKGTKVQLVPLDHARHFENALAWINTTAVSEWLLVGDDPISRLAQEDWFDRNSRETATNIAFAIELLDGTHIGFSGIHEINRRHGFATTGSLIGRQDLWGQGLGTDAVAVRSHYCFHVLGLRLITSGYLEGNERTPRMLAKNGFSEIGRIPQKYWKRGAYRDEILMAITREDWLHRMKP